MKIKKTYQGVLPENKIVNENSTSQTDTYSCNYINNISVVVSETEPTEANRKMVWLKRGENLFDKNTMIELHDKIRYYNNGEIGDVNNFKGVKIPVEPKTKYITFDASNVSNLCFYDKDMNYLSGLAYDTSDKKFTTPTNCKYVTIAVYTSHIDTFKFEIQQEIYVINSSGVYEKFM